MTTINPNPPSLPPEELRLSICNRGNQVPDTVAVFDAQEYVDPDSADAGLLLEVSLQEEGSGPFSCGFPESRKIFVEAVYSAEDRLVRRMSIPEGASDLTLVIDASNVLFGS